MRSRVATVVGGLAVVCLAPIAAAQTDDVSRTPSGRPDLSGTYDVGTLTPMQRPTELGEKMSLTDEEAAAFGARATAALDRRNNIVPSVNTERSDPNRGAPPVGGDGSTGASGNVGGYNTFWIDPGSGAFLIDGQWRTSILVDPPNGRYPPRTRERIAADAAARSGGGPPRQNDGTAYWLEAGWMRQARLTIWSSGRSRSAVCLGSALRQARRCCRSSITIKSGLCRAKTTS